MMTPRANPFLFGHVKAVAQVEEALSSHQLPGGLLLQGPKGVGKATFAYHLARALLEGRQHLEASDPQSPVFARMAAGSHGDLVVAERGLNTAGDKLTRDISVASARHIVEFMHQTSLEGGWRVAIIDSVDELNRQGANTLLKILEEPPQKALLILISHMPGRLLPTLRSRCWGVNLQPLGNDEMQVALQTMLPYLTAVEREAMMTFAEGSLGRAQMLMQLGGQDFMQKAWQALGTIGKGMGRQLYDLIQSVVAKKGEQEDRFEAFAQFLSWWLARAIRQKATSYQSVTPEESRMMEGVLRHYPLSLWVEVWEKSQQLLREARPLSFDERQVLTHVLSLWHRPESVQKENP
ncbi:MAG: DNA polymerase III subunit delta' [Holosporales bacterium]